MISPAAGRDLDAIYDYTARKWGAAQASRYVASFDGVFDRLLDRPELGTLSDDPSGHRRVRHESHFIFYRIIPGKIRVVRILHQRMDVRRHLPDPSTNAPTPPT